MNTSEAWDRQPGETDRSYALFSQYRDAGPVERSLGRTARVAGRGTAAVEKLSQRWAWVDRARAWDAENDRIKRASQIRELESMARRQVLAGQLLESKALKRAQTMSDEEVLHLSVWEMMRMLETGFRLERLGLGEPGDLNTPYTVQQNLSINTADTPIMEILRRNPNRAGPVVEILAKLQELLPELGDGETDDDADDEELAYLLDDSQVQAGTGR